MRNSRHAHKQILLGLVATASALTGVVSSAQTNTFPVAAADSVETHARQAILIDLLANDQDADGDPLSVSISGAPSRGSLLDHGDGTVTYSPDTALFEGSGGDSFGYTIDDGRGGLASATVTVSELPVPPDLQPVAAPTVLLEEGFDGGLTNWTFLDFGPNDGPSNWQIFDGELRQTSNIWGDPAERGTYALYNGGTAWTDYRVKVKLRSHDDDRIGVVFRYQDNDNHYRFDWRDELDSRQLVKIENGSHSVLAQDNKGYRHQDNFVVEVTALGSLLSVYVDGDLVFSVTDTSFSSGTLALNSHGNAGSYFDDVRVTALPQQSPPLLYEDLFDDGDFAGWTPADTGQVSRPSAWRISGGELAQLSNIYGSIFPGVAGTVAVCEAGHSWTDYRFQVKVRATDDDAVLLYFRLQDWQNHYAFLWSRQSNLALLRKMVDGNFVDLATKASGYVSFNTYLVELVAKGDSLEVWVDGSLLLEAQDDALRGGTVGLASEAMASVYFDSVRVTAIP